MSQVLSGPGNIVARKDDKGDLWELYHPLDGASHLPTLDRVPVPDSTTALLSNTPAEKPGTFRFGKVFEEFSVTHPFGSGQFSTRIRLAQGVKRIDIETTLVNQEKKVRYQVLFPTAVINGKNIQEIPFGAIDRPIGVEYPAQNWVDFTGPQRGVALLNNGMAGNAVTHGTMMLSLMRAENLGDYNHGDPSDTGFELNVPRKFRYALVPHTGDWRDAQITRAGIDFNSPLLAFKVAPHPGSLPASWGMVEVSDPNVVVTSFQPDDKGNASLRFYEATGKAARSVRIQLRASVASATETNLLGDAKGKVSVRDNSVVVDLHPFEIKTIAFKLRGGRG
jgi:alpha-mannosidase